MRDRAVFIYHITTKRIEQLLPQLMKKSNIDMWIVISREYDEDPVIKTLLPATWISARRTKNAFFLFKRQMELLALTL
ncbi:hypothetical protein EKO29_11755 [Colwellia sp. Arc7-635]|jgi:hypothetical protein|uniref:hypothetical protein n=1 Tax=Colwellia sp. Arc7-635 TaxID=2497879 RepID=UPI000F852EA9|nr:hypothetical protein [Colwellia sp. Arc7-635]AZQ84631.1 hypothetical protein EKO29_11755 [Colwellia sp. Arc7-635]